MALIVPSGDFTNRDHDSYLQEANTLISSVFPTWTDRNKANFGNMLVELICHALDTASFTQDMQHLETRVQWARLRESMIALGNNYGYILPGAEAATVDFEITIADGNARLYDITIPAGTAIRTEDSAVEFYTIADAVITAGDTQIEGISGIQAAPQTQDFTAPGTGNFEVELSQTPFLKNSSSIEIGVDTYTPVETLFYSTATDKHYVESVDDNNVCTIKFGDGVNGAIPSGVGIITYRTGGGEDGNVDPNTLTRFSNSNLFSAANGESVRLTVRNPSAAGGGVNRMTVEEARLAIPAFVRTGASDYGRSVTHQDFEDNARKVRGVARAMLLTADDVVTIPENSGKLYIVPVGGGLPSTSLKNQVLSMIEDNYPPPISFSLTVHDPELLIVSVTASVSLNRGIEESVARDAIERALDSYFSLINSSGVVNQHIDFGYKVRTTIMPVGSNVATLTWSKIFDVVVNAQDEDGNYVCRSVDKSAFSPTGDVNIDDIEFPVLGSISLVNSDTGLVF